MRLFVSEPIVPSGDGFFTPANGIEPPVPRVFLWRERRLEIVEIVGRSRSTKVDRGDVYLKRHRFELKSASGETLEVYYDRDARRGRPQWWLYAIEEASV